MGRPMPAIINLLKKIPASFKAEVVTRHEPCRICNAKTGKQIGTADYWDIQTSGIIQCGECGHIQLDSMLNEGETAVGCLAYYIEESLRTGAEEQDKNCERNFRRGVVFGYKLKRRNISPRNVLELGPGSGYFSVGLQFVFPGTEITVMDINSDVLKLNAEQHNFKTIQAVPDTFTESFSNRFDLVIARDILEHVTDISKVLDNVYQYLKPNGIFHFITPNGHEDVWKHYLTAKIAKSPSELLINHVNYFDGKGLGIFLQQKGLNPLDYYTFQFKYTLRGQGWKADPKLMSPVSKKTRADFYTRKKATELSHRLTNRTEILNKWYIRGNAKWITFLYCLYHHFSIITVPAEINVGHEIFGLYNKPGPPSGGSE